MVLWPKHRVSCEYSCGMRWKSESARTKSKHGSEYCWPRRNHLLPPMLPMQPDPNAAPVGLMFRAGGKIGVIVDHDIAYDVSTSKNPKPFPEGWWKHTDVRYLRVSTNGRSESSRFLWKPTPWKKPTKELTVSTKGRVTQLLHTTQRNKLKPKPKPPSRSVGRASAKLLRRVGKLRSARGLSELFAQVGTN